jgi:hypothetical protein
MQCLIVACKLTPKQQQHERSCLLQLWAQWVEKTAPYLVLLLVVFVYAHVQGKWLCPCLQHLRHSKLQAARHMMFVIAIQVLQCSHGLA